MSVMYSTPRWIFIMGVICPRDITTDYPLWCFSIVWQHKMFFYTCLFCVKTDYFIFGNGFCYSCIYILTNELSKTYKPIGRISVTMSLLKLTAYVNVFFFYRIWKFEFENFLYMISFGLGILFSRIMRI